MSGVDEKTKLIEKNQLELLCFRLIPDGVVFAINVFKVRETVKFQPLTEIPNVNNMIDGLLTLRDEIIPVVDLRSWLYDSDVPVELAEKDAKIDNKNRQIIVCEFNQVVLGIKVFKADYILRKNWKDIMVPMTTEFGRKVNNYTKNDKNEIVYIVDVEQMLSEIFPEIEDTIERDIGEVEIFAFDRNKRILIAEDSKVALKALEKVLDKLGAKYRSFENGRLLLDYINSIDDIENIGLVITDLEMPNASGFTVIKEIRANPKLKHIPIVVNSSMSGKSNQQMASDLKANGFMAKTSPDKIAGFVKEFLGT